jgi:predicted DNA-binding transcriptional regulator AlpA
MSQWSTADIARHFGVALRTVTNKWTKRPDFPAPAVRISRRTVRWRVEDVMRWATSERR